MNPEPRTWHIQSDSIPTKSYTVTERPNTRNGGTYLYCDCPSWPRMVAKGGCKHVLRVQSADKLVAAAVYDLAADKRPTAADWAAARRILGLAQ